MSWKERLGPQRCKSSLQLVWLTINLLPCPGLISCLGNPDQLVSSQGPSCPQNVCSVPLVHWGLILPFTPASVLRPFHPCTPSLQQTQKFAWQCAGQNWEEAGLGVDWFLTELQVRSFRNTEKSGPCHGPLRLGPLTLRPMCTI